MGRLFWKFFLVFLFAFLTTGVGVGVSVSLWHKMHDSQNVTGVERHAHFAKAAYSVLKHGGSVALKAFLAERESEPFAPPIYAVDESGQDILARPVSAETIAQARELVDSFAFDQAVYSVSADDGHTYLLFASQPGLGFGPDRGPPPDLSHPPGDMRGPPPGHSHDLNAEFRQFSRQPVLPIIAGTLVSFIFSWLLAGYFAKPIRHLRQAFEAMSQGHLHTTAAPKMGKRRDELADLGLHFDHMAERIRILVDAQQQLLHDVSHELRSPLARMQAAIGLALQQPEKMAASLQRIERESQRMSDLIGELLTFSRLEVDDSAHAEQTIDMDELLDEIVEDARFEANHKAVKIMFSRPEHVLLKGRAELVHRAIENVLRNAIQHTANASHLLVDVKLDKIKQRLSISIADQGPGVSMTELTKIFEPFYRGSHKTKQDSIGLGLAIARRAVELHFGKIYAVNRPEGGLRIVMEFPYSAK